MMKKINNRKASDIVKKDEVPKWLILDEQLDSCVRELNDVLQKYDFPAVVEMGILQSLILSFEEDDGLGDDDDDVLDGDDDVMDEADDV
jgi:hypothetical protein